MALWLDDQRVTGLAALIEALAVAYQAERPDLEMGDLTALVVCDDCCEFFGTTGAWRRACRIHDAVVGARKRTGAAGRVCLTSASPSGAVRDRQPS